MWSLAALTSHLWEPAAADSGRAEPREKCPQGPCKVNRKTHLNQQLPGQADPAGAAETRARAGPKPGTSSGWVAETQTLGLPLLPPLISRAGQEVEQLCSYGKLGQGSSLTHDTMASASICFGGVRGFNINLKVRERSSTCWFTSKDTKAT